MKITTHITALALLVTAAACGGTPHPRIGEQVATYASGGTSALVYFYGDGGKLDTIEVLDDGIIEVLVDVSYDDNRITELALSFPAEPGVSGVINIDYKDDRPTLIFRDWGNSDTEEAVLRYDDDRIESVTETASDGDIKTNRFDYDEDDRLERITYNAQYTDSNFSRISTMSYDDDKGFLERVVDEYESSKETTRFSYDDEEDRLDLVTRDVDRYSVDYNSDGYIKFTENRWDGELWSSTSYSYDDGDIDGLVPIPSVVWGQLFHMEGQMMQPLDMRSLEWLAD